MQVVDANGNVFGAGLEVTGSDGKPKVPVINTDITIGTTAIVGGVVGQLLFQGAGNVVQQSSNLFWDNTNGRLGIGGTPSTTLSVNGIVSIVNSAGTNRSTQLTSSLSLDNFSAVAFYPLTGTNVGQSFQVIPKGTGFSAGIKAQFSIFGTDLIADGTNFEAMVVRATGSAFTFSSGKGGTGVVRPMLFSSGFLDGVTNPNQLWLYSTGNVGINTTTDAGYKTDINGSLRVNSSFSITSPSFAGGFSFTMNAANTLVANSSNIGTWLQVGGGNRVYIVGQEFNSTSRGNNFGNTVGGEAVGIANIIAQSSGTTALTGLTIRYAINNTGTYSGIVRGLYYNPTLTSLIGTTHRAIETVTGDVLFATTSGSLLVGTSTLAGFKLDVNGTARVVNDATFSRIATFNSSVVTGGTTTFLVRSNSNTQISVQENNRLNLGAAGGGITYNNVSFSLVPGSFYTFNYVPQNALDTYAFLLTANYTNVGAGGNSQGSMLRTAGSTATQVGNVTMNQIELKPTYNNTGGTTINRGIYYNPTLTSLTGTTHHAFHSTSGRIRFENLPTSPAGLSSGDVWNNLGILTIV